jgi:hypothetical protein
VDDGIVRIALELDARIAPRDPEIKRIMQEEIGQERTDDSPYAKGNFTFDRVICGWRTGLAVLDLRLKR